MLIDTKQIINLTDLRFALGQTIDEVEKGKIFYVSKKGAIKAAFVPITYFERKEKKEELLKAMRSLRERIDRQLRKGKDIWNATEVIRKMRDERTEKLAKYLE